MVKLFGTDGIRGIANKEINLELCITLSKALRELFLEDNDTIIIGKDTRNSGDFIEASLSAFLLSSGINIKKLDIVSTPLVAHATKNSNAKLGIMISASHNPYEFNGIKIFNSNGYKLNSKEEAMIENYFSNKEMKNNYSNKDLGTIMSSDDLIDNYFDSIKDIIKDINIKNLKIAIDPGNGSLSKLSPLFFENLGVETFAINTNPNGKNINDECGSTNPECLKETIIKNNCDIGLSFDGDADRIILLDEKGDVLDGDYILGISALGLKRENKLNHNTIVTTVMSNIGLEKALEKEGINISKTKVGDKYVLEEMLKNNYILGGEQSGHIIFSENNTTGDGLLTSVYILKYLLEENKPLSYFKNILEKFPQILLNVHVENESKEYILNSDNVLKTTKDIESELGSKGRVLLRASGTEPKVRIMIEGEDKDLIKSYAMKIEKEIKKEINNISKK